MQDILFQLDISWQLFLYHVKQLTDEEAFWCKTAEGLQIRKNKEQWIPDWPDTEEYKIGPSSIAWILWHMLYWWKIVINSSFGDGSLQKEDVAWPGNVDNAIEEIVKLHDEWVQHISSMSEEELQSTKLCKWPFTDRSFYSLALWLNVELMKNAAEIGSARFLYAVSSEDIDVLDKGPFYHGTKADLVVGDFLIPHYKSNYGKRNKANFVYFSATVDAATWGAELAEGDNRGRIYIVEPTGAFENDPNLTDKKFPGNPTRSYRSREPLRIVGELLKWEGHSEEVLQNMLDNLENLKKLGIEAINE